MRRKILVVDDVKTSREILKNILKDDYDFIEAENGKEALLKMEQNFRLISAVLLDIGMPVLNGFETLKEMQKNANLSQIPVIVMTGLTEKEGEESALFCGASDYIVKPYNAVIVKQRIKNVINLRETSQTINALQKDRLTMLYNREAFFERVPQIIEEQENGYWTLSCFNIDNFKVINDQNGTSVGDEVLKYIAKILSDFAEKTGGMCCRIMADNFAMVFPTEYAKSKLLDKVHREIENPKMLSRSIVVRVGRYVIDDKTVLPSAMYDRASLAERSIKGRFDKHIAVYNEQMRLELLLEQEIVGEMKDALANREFEIWFQPQCNHSTGAIIGAEALVRWNHPKKGIISPSQFIPVFEQNGFIYELDKFVWEEACKTLQNWKAKAKKHLELSVNVSRYDVFRSDFISILKNLTQKYEIEPNLLHLEITESAFAKSTEQIVEVVNELIALGFIIEIDDFGSGYSSLNTLKSVSAQVVKLDMKFLADGDDSQRGGNILESIVRMTKWLGMSVIAEGVETKEQADYLKSIGCCYVQGYLYAKPMRLADYENLLEKSVIEPTLLGMQTIENLNNNAFWDPKSVETLIFNTYVGNACIMEYHNGKIEIIRANDKMSEMFAEYGLTLSQIMELNWADYMNEANRNKAKTALSNSIKTKGEYTDEYEFINIPNCSGKVYLRMTIRVIASIEARFLVYSTCENITKSKLAELQEQELLDNLPYGAGLFTFDGENLGVVHVNKRYREIMGGNAINPNVKVLDKVHKEDKVGILKEIKQAIKDNRDFVYQARIFFEENDYKTFRLLGRVIPKTSGEYAIYVIYTPIFGKELAYQEKLSAVFASILDKTNNYSFAKDKNYKYICASKSYAKLLGFENQFEMIGKTDYDIYEKAIADGYRKLDMQIIESGVSLLEVEEVIPVIGSAWKHVCISKFRLHSESGEVIGVYGLGRDVTEMKDAYDKLKLLTDSILGGIATIRLEGERAELLYFNEGFYNYSGYTRKEFSAIMKKDVFKLMFKEDVPQLLEKLKTLKKQIGETGECLYRSWTKSGDFRWFLMKGTLSGMEDGALIFNVVHYDVTEQKRFEEILRQNREEYRIAVNHSGNLICRLNVSEKCATLMPEVASSFALPEKLENLPESVVESGDISPETAEKYVEFFQKIYNGEAEGYATFEQKTGNGWRWLDAHFTSVFSKDKKPISAIISFADVTAQRNKEAIYTKWQQSIHEKPQDSYTLFRCNLSKNVAFDSIEGTLLQISFGNGSSGTFNELTKRYAQKFVFAEDCQEYVSSLHTDTLLANYYRGNRITTMEYREVLSREKFRWLKRTIELIEFPNSTDIMAYLMYEDIDEAKRNEIAIKERAEKDALTGIFNRKAFADKMDEKILNAKQGSQLALMMFDIDNFKLVNDNFGHPMGDATLIDVAKKLEKLMRHDDLVGRLGGDEFVVCLCDVKSRVDVAKKAQAICEATEKYFSVEVQISASIGISMCPEHGENFETLYHKADVALYHVKMNGKNTFAFYNEEMEQEQPHPEKTVIIEQENNSDGVIKRRMLIVDDNKVNRDILCNLFKKDFILDTAVSGVDAINRMRQYGLGISIVLLDVAMPEMDGFSVLEKIKTMPELRSIPVVMVSGMDERETSLKAIKCGASDFVTKPIDPELLRLRVDSAIAKFENERLRSQNSNLVLQSRFASKYRAVMQSEGAFTVEYSALTDKFNYDGGTIELYLDGKYNERSLYEIFEQDSVASKQDVHSLKAVAEEVLREKSLASGKVNLTLKTPEKKNHNFLVKIVKWNDVSDNSTNLVFVFNDETI